MRQINDLSVGKKFLAAITLVLVCASFIGTEVYVGLAATTRGMHEIRDVAAPQQAEARQIADNVSQIHQELFRFVAWSSVGVSAGNISRLDDGISRGITQVAQSLVRYKSWSGLTLEERESINHVIDLWKSYAVSARDILDIGSNDAALATIMLGGADDRYGSIFSRLSRLNKDVTQRVENTTSSVMLRTEETRSTLFVGEATFILLVIVLCFFMYRLVLRPIRSVTAAMLAVSNGAIESSLPRTERKDEIGSMIAAIAQFRNKLNEDKAAIAHMALHDSLTGLANRVLFFEHMELALNQLGRSNQFAAILFLDLDGFKSVNDTIGHSVGDKLLVQVAARLKASVRNVDTLCRLGGDEFAILQTGLDQVGQATILAQRLGDIVKAPYEIDGHRVIVGTSIGIAMAPIDGTDASQLLKRADLALYQAKGAGRGTYRFYQPDLDLQNQARHNLEHDLREALNRREFELVYQPVVEANSQRIISFEALIRWNHPTRGQISPADFIPIAEECGLMVPIGEWVLREACEQAAFWPSEIKVAVNLSARQFQHGALTEVVVNALSSTGLAADRLELEITESVLLQDSASTSAILNRLRDIGVQICIDDFGTGYSSLSYLRCFPFDKIKIDQSFVRDIGQTSSAIVKAVTGLGGALNMAITAEGVETADQYRRLTDAGCTEVQGYFVSRPVPLSEVGDLLSSSRPLRNVA